MWYINFIAPPNFSTDKNLYLNKVRNMRLLQKLSYILIETLFAPGVDSFLVEVKGKPVTLRSGGEYEGIDLEGADLSGARLDRINLKNANLSGANLGGAQFRNSNLHGANFRGAVISGVDMTGAELDEGALEDAIVNVEPLGVDDGT